MKEQLTPLQIAVYAVNCPHDGEDTYANEVAGKIQELIDQEKQALKEQIINGIRMSIYLTDVQKDLLSTMISKVTTETLK